MYMRPDHSEFGDVGNFHQKFGLPVSESRPQNVDTELMRFRLNFLLEELKELMEATGAYFAADEDETSVRIEMEGDVAVDHAQAFDALIDLVYVAYGTAHLLGYPWHEGWEEVQTANMSKVRAAFDGSDSKRGSSFDVVKPEGWIPPDIEGLLRLKGWRPEKKCCICHKWFNAFDNITPINTTQGHEQMAHLHCASKEGHKIQ